MRLFSSYIARAKLAARHAGGRRVAAVVALAVAAVVPVAAQQVGGVINQQKTVDDAAAKAQNQVNDLKDQTQDAAARYAQAMAEAESLEKYNQQLTDQVKQQEADMASIDKQLTDIETTSREVEPLMEQMVQTLDQFVSLDVPFYLPERRERVQNLKDLMARADVTISEKYRLILEAYQIELDYGTSLETYEGTLGEGPDARTVQFVKVGRVSLMYQTLDKSETGYWDAKQRKWVADNSYTEAVEQAIRVAQARGAPELLTVPVPAPQEI
jgi:chromosome segregation ATPase